MHLVAPEAWASQHPAPAMTTEDKATSTATAGWAAPWDSGGKRSCPGRNTDSGQQLVWTHGHFICWQPLQKKEIVFSRQEPPLRPPAVSGHGILGTLSPRQPWGWTHGPRTWERPAGLSRPCRCAR